MAPTAALLRDNFKIARSGCRQPGNVFVNKLSELNHLSSSHVKRPPNARKAGEGGASVSPQIYCCDKISERAERAADRRPHTTLSAHELAYRCGSAKARSRASCAVARAAIWPRASDAGRFLRAVIPGGFQRPQRSLLRSARRPEGSGAAEDR
jgi:hypothetical protein